MHDEVPSWKPSDTLSTQLDGQPAVWALGENDQSRSLPEGSVETRCYNSALAAHHETYRSALGRASECEYRTTPKAGMDIGSASATLDGLVDDIGDIVTIS